MDVSVLWLLTGVVSLGGALSRWSRRKVQWERLGRMEAQAAPQMGPFPNGLAEERGVDLQLVDGNVNFESQRKCTRGTELTHSSQYQAEFTPSKVPRGLPKKVLFWIIRRRKGSASRQTEDCLGEGSRLRF